MSKLPGTPPFARDVNLDCPNDLEEFLSACEPCCGRRLANGFGFKGRHAVRAANGLMNYAQNKRTANLLRSYGEIAQALQYEEICDRIYQEDIQPLVKCW